MTVEEANISLESRHSETTSNNVFSPFFTDLLRGKVNIIC